MSESEIASPLVSSGDKFNIDIKGSVLSSPDGLKLQLVPAFVIRADWENEELRRYGFFYLSLEDPEGTQKAIGEEISEYSGEVKDFSLALCSDILISDILEDKKGKIPVEMNIIFGFGEKIFTSKPIKAFINRNKKGEAALVKNYGKELFSSSLVSESILFIGVLCLSFWWISPGWLFWTKCLGGCLPFVSNCKCYSLVTKGMRPMCWHWVPCICVPWFV